jgi:hypothetical protein
LLRRDFPSRNNSNNQRYKNMRIYLIATLLVALLALSGIVSAANTASALVGSDVAAAFEVTSAAPATIIAPALPGSAGYSNAAPVVVNSNVNWDLGVSGTEGGKMIQDIISASNALNVSATATPVYQELTGTEARILSDQTYGAMISVPVTYRQTFGYADKAGLYAITVTWNVSPTV